MKVVHKPTSYLIESLINLTRSNVAVTFTMNLQSLLILFGVSLCVINVSAGEERDLGWGRWKKDDDDWWGGWSKSSKTAEPTFYPTLSPTL